jgi:hypothetical protein
MPTDPARRGFLRFLAASPLMAIAQEPTAKDALSVLDFEPLAKKALPPAHWGYMSTGVDDDLTLRMNRDAMGHYQIGAAAAGRGETGSEFRAVRRNLEFADLL